MKRFLPSLIAIVASLSFAQAQEPLVANIKVPPLVYAGRPLTLDGSTSTKGDDVTYAWKVTEGTIDDPGKPIAHFTPPKWGRYDITLTVTRGSDHKEARVTINPLNDPAKDDSPVYAGAKKILYKEAPDALGGTARLYLHVFDPVGWKPSGKRGAILLFHGGGWSGGSPERYIEDCRYWSLRGLVAISGQYRLGRREGTQPQDCVADAKSAVRYVRKHAAELGIDPNKIAVGGESAGAHIAACTGTVPAYNDPNDDLSISCVPDAMLLYFPYQMICDRGNRKDDMSPLHFVNAETCPTLFIAGEMDRIAPAERGIDWGNQMNGSRNLFRLFIYGKAHHPARKHDVTKPGLDNDLIRQTDLFLAELGWIKGPPQVAPMTAAAIEKLHIPPADFKPLPPNNAPAASPAPPAK